MAVAQILGVVSGLGRPMHDKVYKMSSWFCYKPLLDKADFSQGFPKP